MADDEFQGDQAGLDGLAEPHVVGDEQVHPRHVERTDDRVELESSMSMPERNGAWIVRTSR